MMFNKPYPPSFVASFIITAPILSLLVTRRVLCTPMVGTLTCKSQSNSLRSSSSAIFKQVAKKLQTSSPFHSVFQFFRQRCNTALLTFKASATTSGKLLSECLHFANFGIQMIFCLRVFYNNDIHWI